MFKSESNSTADTIIGPSVHVEGDLVSQGNIHIYGAVTGTVETSANLTVGENAELSANVKAMNAFLSGHLKGNIQIQERLELSATGKIDGDVAAKTLVIAEGAQLNGRCQMGPTTPATNSSRGSKKTTSVSETT